MDEERVKKLVRELIIEVGEDPTREGLRETPEGELQVCTKKFLLDMIPIQNYLYNFQKILM